MKNMVILFLFIICKLMHGQSIIPIIGKTAYPFLISLPENYNDSKKIPVLFFLHGKSLSGTNLNRLRRYGVLSAVEKRKKINAILVTPQLANGSWNAEKLLEILQFMAREYKIDDDRIYVCGMSLGAYGTMEFAGKYPNKIAAAVAICGGGIETDACNLAKIPLWIQHGDADRVVNISESKKMVNAIKKCKGKNKLIFTVIKGGTHGNVEQVFHEDEIYDWMFAQEK